MPPQNNRTNSSWEWSPLQTPQGGGSNPSSRSRGAAASASSAQDKELMRTLHLIQVLEKINKLKKEQKASRETPSESPKGYGSMWQHYTDYYAKEIYGAERKSKIDQINREYAQRFKIPPVDRMRVKDAVEVNRLFMLLAAKITDNTLDEQTARANLFSIPIMANVRASIRQPIQQKVDEFLNEKDPAKRLEMYKKADEEQKNAGANLRNDEALYEEYQQKLAQVPSLRNLPDKAANFADYMVRRSGAFPNLPGSAQDDEVLRAISQGKSVAPTSASREFSGSPVTSYGGYLQNVSTGETHFAPTYNATGAQADVFERLSGRKAPNFATRADSLQHVTNSLSPEDNAIIRGRTKDPATSGTSTATNEAIQKSIEEYLRGSI